MIYFIDKGKIVDFGTHKYLLKHNEKYATLYNKQKKDDKSKRMESTASVDVKKSKTKTSKTKTPSTTKTKKAGKTSL